MYAIIKSGGKQYRVEKDMVIDVERLNIDQGAQVEFTDVLLVQNGSDTLVGEPSVSGYVVKGEILGEASGPKIVSMKYKPRKNRRKKWGHRQHYSRVKIIEIGAAGKSKPKAAAVQEASATAEEAVAEAKPAAKAAAKPKTKKKEGE